MYSNIGFIESLKNKPSYYEEIKPTDQIAMKSSYEPKFFENESKSRHIIVDIVLWVALILGFLCLMCLDFKHTIIIDTCIVMFILAMYIFDFVDFTRVSIGISIVFLVVSLVIEILWVIFYVKNWKNSAYFDEGMLVHLRRYENIMSWLTIGFKSLLLLLLLLALCLVGGQNRSKAYSTGYNSKMVVPLQ